MKSATIRELSRIAPGSEEASELKAKALGGKPDDVRRYVLWCMWLKIRGNKSVPREKKLRAFVDLDRFLNVQVTVNGV